MTIAVTRRELDAGGLRREAARCRDARAARRMLALALVLEGSSRQGAARHAGMDRQTLRDWVHRYNAEGLAGPRSTTAASSASCPAVSRGLRPDRGRSCRPGRPSAL